MKVLILVKRLRSFFCIRHKWLKSRKQGDDRPQYRCEICGRQKYPEHVQELHILLPEQFRGEES